MFYDIQSVTATIANGASLSGAVRFGGLVPILIVVPATWTTADLTFQVSVDGTTFGDFRDMYGTEIKATVTAAGNVIQLDPSTFAGVQYLKVRSGTTSSVVNQGGDRSIVILCKPF